MQRLGLPHFEKKYIFAQLYVGFPAYFYCICTVNCVPLPNTLCNFSGIDVDLSSHLGAGIGFRKTSAFLIASSTLLDTRRTAGPAPPPCTNNTPLWRLLQSPHSLTTRKPSTDVAILLYPSTTRGSKMLTSPASNS
jgi:hypothetical protein